MKSSDVSSERTRIDKQSGLRVGERMRRRTRVSVDAEPVSGVSASVNERGWQRQARREERRELLATHHSASSDSDLDDAVRAMKLKLAASEAE